MTPRATKPAAKTPRKVAGKSPRAKAAPGARAASPTRHWADLVARDILRRQIVTIDEAAPLSDVERAFSENRISGAPVVDEAGRIIGVVTLRDLIERYAEEPDARPRRGPGFYHVSSEELEEEDLDAFEVPPEAEETAVDIMTAQIFSVPAAAPLKDIAAEMTKHRIHRVLVEEGGRYVGLISTFEILGALARHRP